MIKNDSLPTSSVFDLPLHLSSNYLAWLAQRLTKGKGGQVVTLNAEMAMLAQKNPRIHDIIQQADLIVPDGAGIIFYLRLQGRRQHRCPGIELAADLIHHSAQQAQPYPIAFYGGAPGVALRAADYWQSQYPQLTILANHGFLSEPEQAQWCRTLAEKQPAIIFVALGVPRQEYWIQDHRHLCPQALWMGVGGSFDVWSGEKQRAPQWFCDNHLEWLYRLYQEPWRWRRMLVLPRFAWKSLYHHFRKA
ncbi:WecB/TagA/CpsF family glycosyltransferase [Synechocystis sp. LKSZ1]|uniref:WecB/TagA/CpsF family glycosyltransferase n=1 Tax=Synechocystis sp. LKSZ1 TaxID=3144951 RepID=UPI00336C1669